MLVAVVAGSATKFYSSQKENKKETEEELWLQVEKLQEEMEIKDELNTKKEKEVEEEEVPEVTATKTPLVDPHPTNNVTWHLGYLW